MYQPITTLLQSSPDVQIANRKSPCTNTSMRYLLQAGLASLVSRIVCLATHRSGALKIKAEQAFAELLWEIPRIAHADLLSISFSFECLIFSTGFFNAGGLIV